MCLFKSLCCVCRIINVCVRVRGVSCKFECAGVFVSVNMCVGIRE